MEHVKIGGTGQAMAQMAQMGPMDADQAGVTFEGHGCAVCGRRVCSSEAAIGTSIWCQSAGSFGKAKGAGVTDQGLSQSSRMLNWTNRNCSLTRRISQMRGEQFEKRLASQNSRPRLELIVQCSENY